MEPTQQLTTKRIAELLNLKYDTARKRLIVAGVTPVQEIGRNQLWAADAPFAIDKDLVLQECCHCPLPIGVNEEHHTPHDSDCAKKYDADSCNCSNVAHVTCCEKNGCAEV